MHRLVIKIQNLKKKLVPVLLVTLLVAGAGCDIGQGASEQMVNLDEVSDDPEAQLANLNAAISRNSKDASLYFRRAKLLLKKGDEAKALADVNEAIRLDKNNMANLFLKAQVLRSMGRVGEALPLALKAERNSYQSVALYVLLSDLYMQLNQPQKAGTYTAKALALAPRNEFALYYRGRVATAVSDTARAVQSFRSALKEAPEFAEARRELAGVLIAQQKYGEAGVEIQKAYKLMPKDGLLWFYQGQLYEGRFKTDSALWSYNKAIQLADTLYVAHYRTGLLLYVRGDNAGAIPHLEKAAKAYSKDAKFVTTLASAYERTGQNIKALEQYQNLVSLQPGYSYASQSVARVKAKLTRPAPVYTDTARVIETENNITSQ